MAVVIDKQDWLKAKRLGAERIIQFRLEELNSEISPDWKEKYEEIIFNNEELVIKYINEDYKKPEKIKIEDRGRVIEELGVVYEDIIKVLKRYIDLEEDYYPLISLWIIGSYTHRDFQTYPFLFLNAMRGSGKTRLLKLISHLSFMGRGKVQTGLTEAVLFRTTPGSTLIIDEFESVGSKEKANLREYLNACYKKGATVSRNKKIKGKEGEDYVIEEFEPYRPIAIANIWGMEEVLEDRCITLILEKSNDPSKTKLMENFDQDPLILRSKEWLVKNQCSLRSVVMPQNIYTLWNDYIHTKYTNTYTTYNYTNYNTTKENPENILITLKNDDFFNRLDSKNINGRNLELIFPILTLGGVLGDDVLKNILDIYERILNIKKNEEKTESKDILLYEFISKQSSSDLYRVKDLTKMFRSYLNEEEDEDKWLNSRWVGRALKRLKIYTLKRRTSQGIEVLLNVEKAKQKLELFQTGTITEKELLEEVKI